MTDDLLARARAEALTEYEAGIRSTGTNVPNAFVAGFVRGWDAREAQLPDREAVINLLNSAQHAPMETHDPRDGTCTQCPWPLHMLTPGEIADAVLDLIRGGNRESGNSGGDCG